MSEDIRITRGVPTDEELAAIVGVLMLRPTAVPAPRTVPTSRWSASSRPGYARPDGRPTQLGPSAWRSSVLPH
jgi:Acyl-CoA carboxylase epsilon subunit